MTYGAGQIPPDTAVQAQEKQLAGLFLGIFLTAVALCVLGVLAVPHLGLMTGRGSSAARADEYRTIRIAVMEMLNDSPAGALVPTGPTTDMGRVHTADASPLVLTDYLNRANGKTDRLGCRYTFATSGTVIQVMR